MNADGSGLRRLTRNTVGDRNPVWSPDGRRIAFESNWQVNVMNADGSGQRRLTRNGGRNFAPAWSPDGQKIAFERRLGRKKYGPCNGCGRASTFEICVMNADGSGQQQADDTGRAAWLVTRRAEDRVHERARRQRGDLRHERRRQRAAEPDANPGPARKRACLVARAETVSVTAPPRPPRPGDPVDREELEALVEALIEEARQRARRRRRIYAASVALVALVVVARVGGSPALDTAGHLFVGVRGAVGPSRRSDRFEARLHQPQELRLLWPRRPLPALRDERRWEREAAADTPCVGRTCVVARWAEDRLRRRHPRRQGRDLRHQRRWQREAERDAHRGIRVRSCLVARRAEDRLQPRRRTGTSRCTS